MPQKLLYMSLTLFFMLFIMILALNFIDEQKLIQLFNNDKALLERVIKSGLVLNLFLAFGLLVPTLTRAFVKRVQKVIEFGGSDSTYAIWIKSPEFSTVANRFGDGFSVVACLMAFVFAVSVWHET